MSPAEFEAAWALPVKAMLPTEAANAIVNACANTVFLNMVCLPMRRGAVRRAAVLLSRLRCAGLVARAVA
jgi:hypothetical protein